jgi:AcrR family transcriptional regulator
MKKKTTEHSEGYKPKLLKNTIPSSAKDQDLIDKRQAQIREAACNLFFEKGFHGTSIREIATESKMSMGQLYHYISSKDDILFLVYKHMQELWHGSLIAFGFEDINDPLDKLIKAIQLTLDFPAKNKKLFQFVFTETKYLDKEHLKIILEMDNANVSGFFKNLLIEVDKKYPIDYDLDLASKFITFNTLFLALRAWNLKEWPTAQIEEFLVTFFIKGLGLKVQKNR